MIWQPGGRRQQHLLTCLTRPLSWNFLFGYSGADFLLSPVVLSPRENVGRKNISETHWEQLRRILAPGDRLCGTAIWPFFPRCSFCMGCFYSVDVVIGKNLLNPSFGLIIN